MHLFQTIKGKKGLFCTFFRQFGRFQQVLPVYLRPCVLHDLFLDFGCDSLQSLFLQLKTVGMILVLYWICNRSTFGRYQHWSVWFNAISSILNNMNQLWWYIYISKVYFIRKKTINTWYVNSLTNWMLVKN